MLGALLALLAVAVVFVTEQVLKPEYALKSTIKVLSFMGVIGLYCALFRKKFTDVIGLHKIGNGKPLLCYMLCFFVGTMAAFLIFKDFLD